jgi:hypothetical protein
MSLCVASIAAMNGAPSDHRELLGRPCWYCRWWGGTSGPGHGLCARPGGNVKQAQPRMGCAFYEREPGVDDDAWQPTWAPLPELKAPSQRRAQPGQDAVAMPLILEAPGATPERLGRGLAAAREVFAAAGVDPREAWAALVAGVIGEASSTWDRAEMAALDAAGVPGRLSFADDD